MEVPQAEGPGEQVPKVHRRRVLRVFVDAAGVRMMMLGGLAVVSALGAVEDGILEASMSTMSKTRQAMTTSQWTRNNDSSTHTGLLHMFVVGGVSARMRVRIRVVSVASVKVVGRVKVHA